jgi:hypothetical protein
MWRCGDRLRSRVLAAVSRDLLVDLGARDQARVPKPRTTAGQRLLARLKSPGTFVPVLLAASVAAALGIVANTQPFDPRFSGLSIVSPLAFAFLIIWSLGLLRRQ